MVLGELLEIIANTMIKLKSTSINAIENQVSAFLPQKSTSALTRVADKLIVDPTRVPRAKNFKECVVDEGTPLFVSGDNLVHISRHRKWSISMVQPYSSLDSLVNKGARYFQVSGMHLSGRVIEKDGVDYFAIDSYPIFHKSLFSKKLISFKDFKKKIVDVWGTTHGWSIGKKDIKRPHLKTKKRK